ncbi:capsule assembly Wzi family protein [Dyadobacter sp. NIV53]|uniref:capsule assembly Wzi family protein n=1 Tax=Dyadobacter sp. NIV53 TaxID=2861765 RepID=UPI001C87B771|nr:capsule assembly Wzi family protein [Dyadobacter sp. NIV53]
MNLFRISILIFLGVLIFESHCFGQSRISDFLPHVDLEAGAVVSPDSDTPFWIRTNQYGIIPGHSPFGIIQLNLYRDYKKPDSISKVKRKFDWGFVVNPVVTYDKENKSRIVIPEAHVKIRFKNIEFYAGRKRDVMGLGDSTLSSGFYAVSGNALPIPKIQISTVGYVPVAFHKFLAINAGFAHGWINTPPYIYGARLHQKYLYFRFGKPVSKTKFYFGVNHQVTWAGHSDYLRRNPDLAINGQLPNEWNLFPYVVLGYTPKNWFKKAGYTSFDSYRIGNHVGSYDAALETKINGDKLLLYYQHAYEDVSSLLFKNAPDGLWGANWQLHSNSNHSFKLTRLTLEFLTTTNQSGTQFYIPGSIYQGADNYFNHSQYTEGYSYQGATIGTPFITPGKDLDQSKHLAPRFFPNNRINMFYLGAQGKYHESLLLTLRTSYSQNFGMPGDSFSPSRGQFSSLLSAQLSVKNWYNTTLIAKLSMDKGKLFNDSYGGYLGVKKSW